MNQRVLVIAAIVAGVLIVAGGLFAYNAVLGETEAASGPITAPTLAVEAAAATTVPARPAASEAAAAVPVSPTPAPTQAAPTRAAASAPGGNPAPVQTTASAGDAALPGTSAGLAVYQIDQAQSQASFTIYELLRGSPKNVVGTTSQVAGEVAVDLSDLSTAQAGEILINARTLATDDDRRNGAIRNRILFTDQYEYVSFKPTQVSGLSGSAAPGQAYTFQISGDLTIRDVTQPVTFDVTVTVESPERLVGTAKTTIRRADYGINIPSVPFVANVGDDVALEIQFVLVPKA